MWRILWMSKHILRALGVRSFWRSLGRLFNGKVCWTWAMCSHYKFAMNLLPAPAETKHRIAGKSQQADRTNGAPCAHVQKLAHNQRVKLLQRCSRSSLKWKAWRFKCLCLADVHAEFKVRKARGTTETIISVAGGLAKYPYSIHERPVGLSWWDATSATILHRTCRVQHAQ